MGFGRRTGIVDYRHYVVPMVMLVVAAIHMWQWKSISRSSWGTGAGFGMFATVDYHGSRFFRCYLMRDGKDTPIAMPDSLKKNSGLIARAMPTQDNLRHLANKLSQTLKTQHDSNQAAGIETVLRVELWTMSIDARSRLLRAKKLRDVSVPFSNQQWACDDVAKVY